MTYNDFEQHNMLWPLVYVISLNSVDLTANYVNPIQLGPYYLQHKCNLQNLVFFTIYDIRNIRRDYRELVR